MTGLSEELWKKEERILPDSPMTGAVRRGGSTVSLFRKLGRLSREGGEGTRISDRGHDNYPRGVGGEARSMFRQKSQSLFEKKIPCSLTFGE